MLGADLRFAPSARTRTVGALAQQRGWPARSDRATRARSGAARTGILPQRQHSLDYRIEHDAAWMRLVGIAAKLPAQAQFAVELIRRGGIR